MKVRKAVPEDALLLSETRKKVWQTTYRGIYPDEMLDKYDVAFHAARDRRTLETPDLQFYLVFDGDACIGYYSYGHCTYGSYRDFAICLNSLYLLPEYRRHGFGSAVFREIRSYCAERKIPKFFCSCQAGNLSAAVFYEAMGGHVGMTDLGHENAAENTIYFEFTVEEES